MHKLSPFLASLVLSCLAFASCQSLHRESKSLATQNSCARGLPYIFSLEKLAANPQPSSIILPKTYPWRFTAPNLSHNIKLDVCLDATGVYPAMLTTFFLA